jgi:hypothetical protein
MSDESNLVKGYETAAEIALDRLLRIDPVVTADRAGVEWTGEAFRVEYLAKNHLVGLPDGFVSMDGSDAMIKPAIRALLLQYLATACGKQPTGELIAFRDIPGAAGYEVSFRKRAIAPLLKVFDGKPDLLIKAALALNGEQAAVGDVGVKISVLPLIPVVYGIWHSDEEFTADGVILFDSSIKTLGSIELAVVTAANGVYQLINQAFLSSKTIH